MDYSYHYTTIDAIISIMQNKTIRFTDCDFLNDPKEYKLLDTLWDGFVKDFSESDEFNEEFINMLKMCNVKKRMVRPCVTSNDSRSFPYGAEYHYYVFCTSTDGDSQFMWNSYADDSVKGGYNLKIDVNRMRKSMKQYETDMGDCGEVYSGCVCYTKTEQEKMIKEELLSIQQRYMQDKCSDQKETESECKAAIVHMKERMKIMCKDEDHKGEQEYRFIVLVKTMNKTISLRYRSLNGFVVPYIEMKIDGFSEIITQICMSPLLYYNYEIARRGLGELCHNTIGMDIPIVSSKISERY